MFDDGYRATLMSCLRYPTGTGTLFVSLESKAGGGGDPGAVYRGGILGLCTGKLPLILRKTRDVIRFCHSDDHAIQGWFRGESNHMERLV